jgi:hypothetical protein
MHRLPGSLKHLVSDDEKGDQITAELNEASRRKPAEEMGGESADKPDEGRILCIIQVTLKAFFDGISHEWLVKFIEHRAADRRVVRLIRKWLHAGVLEDEEVPPGTASGEDAPSGIRSVWDR